jgi:hypothetical protein
VLGAILDGSIEDSSIALLFIGPFITEQMQMADFFDMFEPLRIETMTEINQQSRVIIQTVFNIDHMPEGLNASFSAIRNEIIEDGVLTVRRPTVSEFDWYWTIISWDISEPVFVLETVDHSFFIDFGSLGPGMMYIDDMRDLEWPP